MNASVRATREQRGDDGITAEADDAREQRAGADDPGAATTTSPRSLLPSVAEGACTRLQRSASVMAHMRGEGGTALGVLEKKPEEALASAMASTVLVPPGTPPTCTREYREDCAPPAEPDEVECVVADGLRSGRASVWMSPIGWMNAIVPGVALTEPAARR